MRLKNPLYQKRPENIGEVSEDSSPEDNHEEIKSPDQSASEEEQEADLSALNSVIRGENTAIREVFGGDWEPDREGVPDFNLSFQPEEPVLADPE